MTEEEARDRVLVDVSRETACRMDAFVQALNTAAQDHNLVAVSTLNCIWYRHILDSAQLIPLAAAEGSWLDMGSGGGLPGMVVAILRDRPTMLIEPRRLRADFLKAQVDHLGLQGRVDVRQCRIEAIDDAAPTVISARAVAPLDTLFQLGRRIATDQTQWVLPKGRSAAEEVATARRLWHADIRMVPSLTDSAAAIVVATGVRRKQP